MSEVQDNNEKPTNPTVSIGSIFSSRKFDNVKLEEKATDAAIEEDAKDPKKIVGEAPKNEDKQKVKVDEEPKDVDYKSQLEKLEKTVKDTQRSFHEDRKKLAAYKRAVQKLNQEGTLLDEEAAMLLDHTQFESEPENIADEPILVKYAKVWDKELEYMKKYAPDSEQINRNIFAFQHLIQSVTQEELQDIFEELAQYEEDEVELTKQMLEMGRQYNDDIYSDIHEAGGIRKLKAKFSEKQERLEKELDKLKEKYSKLKEQYEDYDPEPGNLRLPSGSSNTSVHNDKKAKPTVTGIFASRFSQR